MAIPISFVVSHESLGAAGRQLAACVGEISIHDSQKRKLYVEALINIRQAAPREGYMLGGKHGGRRQAIPMCGDKLEIKCVSIECLF